MQLDTPAGVSVIFDITLYSMSFAAGFLTTEFLHISVLWIEVALACEKMKRTRRTANSILVIKGAGAVMPVQTFAQYVSRAPCMIWCLMCEA